MIIRARIRRLVLERGSAIKRDDVGRVLRMELTRLARLGAVSPATVKQGLGRALTMERRQRGRQ